MTELTMPKPIDALDTAPASAATLSTGERSGHPRGARIEPADPRYASLRTGNNQRFVASPDYVRMVCDAEDTRRAVQEAVDEGKRFTVRSGGHCMADFVCNPETEVILDMTLMSDVGFDPDMQAFFVEPGGLLIDVYERLYKGWGVTLPAGICFSVGIGGHIVGGGYGFLSRQHGLTVDHLWAVEVVTVDTAGRAHLVRATADPADPHHDLWWAHTGGGGGNFGVVTRYWFRTPGAVGPASSDLLIAPPSEVLVSAVAFSWADLDEMNFSRLVSNYGDWHAAHAAPDDPCRALTSMFFVTHRAAGALGLFTQVDGDDPQAEMLLESYMRAMLEGTTIRPMPVIAPIGELPAMPDYFGATRLPWLLATKLLGSNNPVATNPTLRGGHKSCYMKQNFTAPQIATLYRYLSGDAVPGFDNPNATLMMFSFGGAVNIPAPDATAIPQRSSIWKIAFHALWRDPAEDEAQLGWLRALYEDLFAETGGVPVPNAQLDGCYINYPDSDMADPAHNRSGVPWTWLYYKDNYARLQAVKDRYDPRNVLRHSLSVRNSHE